jgi:predicted cupin superfamily sugar epimerase
MVHRNAMNEFDHYAAARALITRLERDGHTADAARLRSAIEDGATGTEIFMALHFFLSEIVRRVPLVGESQVLASRLLAELNDALK